MVCVEAIGKSVEHIKVEDRVQVKEMDATHMKTFEMQAILAPFLVLLLYYLELTHNLVQYILSLLVVDGTLTRLCYSRTQMLRPDKRLKLVFQTKGIMTMGGIGLASLKC
jgi:hypothetical protein